MAALDNLTTEIKEAMKAKNALALEALRAIKSAVLLQKVKLEHRMECQKMKK